MEWRGCRTVGGQDRQLALGLQQQPRHDLPLRFFALAREQLLIVPDVLYEYVPVHQYVLSLSWLACGRGYKTLGKLWERHVMRVVALKLEAA